jgi:hypothetical protein
MIGQMLLLSALTFPCQEQPQVELVLKGTYRIGRASAVGIIPLGDRYLCFGSRYPWVGKTEFQIFDRQTKKVVFTRTTELLEFVHALARHKDYIYAHVGHQILRIPVKDATANEPPTLGPAQQIDLNGESAEQLLHTDTVVAVRTENNKIFILENGVVKKDKSIYISDLAGDMIRVNERWRGQIFFKLIAIGANTKLLVVNGDRLRIYDFGSLRIDGDYGYEGMNIAPWDVAYAGGKYLLTFWDKLRVIDAQGKSTDYKIPQRCYRIAYLKQQSVVVMIEWGDMIFMPTIGKLEKPYTIRKLYKPNEVAADVASFYAEGDKLYVGLGAFDYKDDDVGGDLLEFEIKVNRR